MQGAKYNIPLAIWLPEKYPRASPIVYVVPTQDMMIKPRHSFVTPSGVVNSDYVKNWTYRCLPVIHPALERLQRLNFPRTCRSQYFQCYEK